MFYCILYRSFVDVFLLSTLLGATNEGLSWGKSAVEMGLARMSALGMFKPQEGVDDKKPESFSKFNASMPTKPMSEKNETKVKKPFGF
jgi:hypothetical protein